MKGKERVKMKISAEKGIYFLANDDVYELVVAFLNSLRKFNPSVPLCLIPFNDKTNRIILLKDRYNFTVFNDEEKLRRCDQISTDFHDHYAGHYRKLVMWEGIFEKFIYIDVDTIVLKNLDFVFDLLDQTDIMTSFSNLPSIRKWVWKEEIMKADILTKDQIEYAANTGFIASHKGKLSIRLAESKLSEIQKLKPYMELHCMEQPFLNYLFVTSGLRLSGLYRQFVEHNSQVKYLECWGGQKIIRKKGELFKSEDGRQIGILFIHWAGLWQPRKADHLIFIILKYLKLRKEFWRISLFMPQKKYWKKFLTGLE